MGCRVLVLVSLILTVKGLLELLLHSLMYIQLIHWDI